MKRQLTIVAVVAALMFVAARAGAFGPGAPWSWWGVLLSDRGLAIFAIVLGVGGIFLAARHDRQMERQVTRLEELTAAVPTHVSAEFGVHLRCITELIAKTPAGGFIDVMVDCADYGSYFDPASHSALLAAFVATKERGVRVRMLVCGPAQPITQTSVDHGQLLSALHGTRDSRARLQTYLTYLRREREQDDRFKAFLDARLADDSTRAVFRRWLIDVRAPQAELLGDAELKRRLELCLKIYGRKNAMLEPSDDAAFKLLLLAREEYFEAILRKADVIVQRFTSYQPMIFFWLRTNCVPHDEAAFIFPKSGGERVASTMTSLDRHIIDGFSGIFEYQWQAMEAAHPGASAPA